MPIQRTVLSRHNTGMLRLAGQYWPYSDSNNIVQALISRQGAFTEKLSCKLLASAIQNGTYFNNWGIEVPLVHRAITDRFILSAEKQLSQPDGPFLIAGLLDPFHRNTLTSLKKSGFLVVPLRQVFYHEKNFKELKERISVQEDLALARKFQWSPCTKFEPQHWEQLSSLKFAIAPTVSGHQTGAFLRDSCSSGWLQGFGVICSSNQLESFVAVHQHGGWQAVAAAAGHKENPALGHRQALSKVMQLAVEQDLRTLWGSQAAELLKPRGAVPIWEYLAISPRNLQYRAILSILVKRLIR